MVLYQLLILEAEINVNLKTWRHGDQPVRHDLLSTEYEEKISTCGQTADQSPVLLHPHSVFAGLETLNRDFIIIWDIETLSVSVEPTRLVFYNWKLNKYNLDLKVQGQSEDYIC